MNDTTPQSPPPPPAWELPLPGIIGIALYLFLIAGVIILGVVGHHYPALFLFFPMVFIAAAGGLLGGFRWAWALALAAVFLLALYNLWVFGKSHEFPLVAQGLLNMVFFLYLIRPEVRDRLH